jgi:glyoxylate reductase
MMRKNKLPVVIMTHSLPREWISSLEGVCELYIGPTDATEFDRKLINILPRAEGLFTLLTIPINENLLLQATKLRVISNMAVGVDNLDINACTIRKNPVGNTPGVLTESTADLTMALLLSIARLSHQASLDAHQGGGLPGHQQAGWDWS